MPPPPRVLVVADDPASRIATRAALAPLPAEITCVGSGERALAELDGREYAVALLDVAMPRLGGFETAQRLTERDGPRPLPIIFLTGEIDDARVRRGYAVGGVDVVHKPYDPEILRSKVAVFVELARLRLESEVLVYRTLHDQLTGLANRTLLLDRLRLALARLEHEEGWLSVLFVDLDGFKSVNDTLGHAAGDSVLIDVAARLGAAIRASDTAARYGGDEFVVLCDRCEGDEGVGPLVERLRRALADPLTVEGRELRLTASIGHARTADPRTTPDALIRAADAAMLDAKAHSARRTLRR